MSSVKPITPSQAIKDWKESIPDEVILSFNELIAENMSKDTATIKQKDVMDRIKSKLSSMSREEIFKKKYLDVEKIFEEAGWHVKYEKPAMDESFDAYFKFTPQTKVKGIEV